MKSLWLKRLVWFFIIVSNVWYFGFKISIFNYEPGAEGYIPYYSPNCEYYVRYRQSLWEKMTDPYPWGVSTVYLYNQAGKLLHKSKTSTGNSFNPYWLSGRKNSVFQGDTENWWEYDLPTSPGDRWHPQNCHAQTK
ncbi:hypothetical protein [Herbaspirillum sp. Sphag64]|uniref:hypothetical protein n=1 Tax=Herbaspirillum sp. Sphag64 TaxID=2587029 RepID=UPI001C8652C3|nr:hypothetical protein [Herbaspirillum sp. Sphag64]